MILGFKQQFPDGTLTHFRRKIERDEKIHSIREDRHGRWRTGRLIQCSYGVRTKAFYCFSNKFCTGTQQIVFRWQENPRKCVVYVDGRELSKSEVKQLAINDGFSVTAALLKWFNKDFSGKIIHWTLYRY
jgi:hypothetical protein